MHDAHIIPHDSPCGNVRLDRAAVDSLFNTGLDATVINGKVFAKKKVPLRTLEPVGCGAPLEETKLVEGEAFVWVEENEANPFISLLDSFPNYAS